MRRWLAQLEALHPLGAAGIELGLARVQAVRARLGQAQTIPVITVAGTNGKGSTCALLESVLRAAGYRTGLYTSPHLLRYNERIRIAGRPVVDAALCAAFARVEAARQAGGAVALTYFEFGTLAAWECFAAAGVDVAILEVGLGGRLDAVNCYDADCAVITGIALDHCDYLGTTRTAIAREKAGIMRAGRPAVCAETDPPRSLLAHAAAVGAQLRRAGTDFGWLPGTGQWQYWSRAGVRLALPLPALAGRQQLANAAAALAALESLQRDLPLTLPAIKRGLRAVRLPGRFEVHAGAPTLILDVAHNAQAASTLAANLRGLPAAAKTWAVFGMLRDKDIPAVVAALREQVTCWLPCSLPGPRGLSAGELRAVLAGSGAVVAGEDFATPAQAYAAARALANEGDRILIFGSFLTVADVKRRLAQGA